jgi:8-oxo-dGTP pyrophosphatase MutT (NUDIX family)
MKNRVERLGEQMKRSQTSQFLSLGEDGPRNQFAALCWRLHRGRVEVLLITSRDTGRWVIPKGWPVADKSPAESAAQEAWEEAGVRGQEGKDALGLYTYDKLRGTKEALPCAVSVFPLRVEELAARFPERKERRRRWFGADKAAKLVAEPELRALFQKLAHDPAVLTQATAGPAT